MLIEYGLGDEQDLVHGAVTAIFDADVSVGSCMDGAVVQEENLTFSRIVRVSSGVRP